MKIQRITLENFMLFDKLEAEFSPHINILCGENSTGKTALIKALYACAKARENARKDQKEGKVHFGFNNSVLEPEDGRQSVDLRHPAYWRDYLCPRLLDVFLPDEEDIRRLSNRYSVDRPFISACFFGDTLKEDEVLWIWWKKNGYVSRTAIPELSQSDPADIVFIPTREIISATENFASLYEDYNLPFDETYYHLTRLLDRPRKRTLSPAYQSLKTDIERIIGGKLIQRGRTFYLDIGGDREIEMSLVSDGWRKFATILNLIASGTLSDGSILFWDEPETNMNPKMTQKLVNILVALAAEGVQVFVTTHDYFVQQYFGLAAKYGEQYQKGNGALQYRFFSLNRERKEPDSGETGSREQAAPESEPEDMDTMGIKPEDSSPAETITIDWADHLVDLKHNAVSEEYDELYDREMELLYANDTD